MQALEALKRFFKPTTDVTVALAGDPFIVLDREAAANKLKIAERAKANGTSNFPPPDADYLDDAESEIVAEISEHAARAQIDAGASHRVYGQRLSELALLRELSTITGASEQALGDFRAIIINKKGRLALAKAAIKESSEELNEFKRHHELKRPAHRGIKPITAWATILTAWCFETLCNTAFLKVNDDYGIVGGAVAAAGVAAINISFSALVGKFWWPYLGYKKPVPRFLAIGGTLLWFLGVVAWNLVVGHFRDAKAGGLPDPEHAALSLFANHTFILESISSYALLIAGIVFAVLSATVTFKEDDPYAGYGAINRRFETRCEDYANEIEDALAELREIRDEAITFAAEIRDELGTQFRERGQIITARDSYRTRYREHQDYLESVGNALLGQYRAANVQSRTDGSIPKHFNKSWSLKRSELPNDLAEPAIDDEVLRAQEALERSIKTISSAYQEAIETFEHLDKITGSLTNE